MQTCVINLVHLDPPHNGGMSRVARLVSRLLAEEARAGKWRVVFLVGWRVAGSFREWSGIEEAAVVPVIPEEAVIPFAQGLQPDLLVSPLFGMDPLDSVPEWRGIPHVVSMPDALVLDRPDLFAAEEVERRRLIYENLRNARLVVTLSQDARARLIRHLEIEPTRVSVILLGSDPPGLDGTHPVEGNPLPPYVLYPANGWPHKRHELLLRAMNQIWKSRPELRLVLTGWHPEGYIEELIARLGCPRDKVVNLGYVEESARMPGLYRAAEALLFASEYEGFGMPVLEAMTLGCPVICAPLTALPEVAGEAALYVDSAQPSDWARAFLETLPARREEVIALGRRQAGKFTWTETERLWRQALTDPGVALPGAAEPGGGGITLKVVSDELLLWSSRFQRAQLESEAKERVIQTFLRIPFLRSLARLVRRLQSLWLRLRTSFTRRS